MKIYTRTGDAGTTSLVGGIRVDKNSPRLEAYGEIDELNSTIGLLLSYPQLPQDARETLAMVQNKLFNIGAYLATENAENPMTEPAGLGQQPIATLEHRIDLMTGYLPQLNNFILPTGDPAACQAHICRTVCRRAERRIVALSRQCRVDDIVIRFVNRLSDYLFTLARFINHTLGIPETTWQQ